jgi:HAD superfamily hydrolase (TIGR01509 family)
LPYDAILFDLDGTLIDTERVAMTTGRDAFAEFGHADVDALLHRLVGVDQPSASGIILSALPDLDLAALTANWQARFDAALRVDIPLKPHAAQVVKTLAQRHDLALVTSSGRMAAMDKLDRTGLLPAFRLVITRDDVRRPKPDPEPYLRAAEQLSATPARCLVFEDSDTGARAAHEAGMVVVQVPDTHAPSGRYAHHIAPDLLAGLALAGLIL